MGIGSKRQVVGFTWEKTRPSVLASTRAKLSSVSSGKSNGVLKTTFCSDKRLDLISSILLLKWSENSMQRASEAVMGDLLRLLLVKRLKVEKINLGLFLLFVMRFEKWVVLASLTVLL